MTIICAMRAPEGTWIGSDTLVLGGESGIVGYKKKWIVRDDWALGICGSNAASCAIMDSAEFIDPDWSATKLWKWATAILRELEFKPEIKEGHAPWYDCSFILARPGRVMSVCATGGGVEHAIGEFASRGHGCDIADGAAWARKQAGMTAQNIVRGAVEAAIACDRYCGGEPFIHCLEAAP